ncbi:hypothetical protein FNV43_RR15736 [Rhamnella rubrinervis]|uniref:Uncharacterized protein n=1 Tax=Rhamnella rubrinervis TaxID=2594499 RepID=A0A8K0GXD1_9ROSA|nr:hypothetical protein FNV43_RR15736 [Rhamnella rubrinervis]
MLADDLNHFGSIEIEESALNKILLQLQKMLVAKQKSEMENVEIGGDFQVMKMKYLGDEDIEEGQKLEFEGSGERIGSHS